MIKLKLTGQFVSLLSESKPEIPSETSAKFPESPVLLFSFTGEKGVFTVENAAGLNLSVFLQKLGVDNTGVKYTALVNNSRSSKDYMLLDSDYVLVMPLLAGG
jgi:hypothetical protein